MIVANLFDKPNSFNQKEHVRPCPPVYFSFINDDLSEL